MNGTGSCAPQLKERVNIGVYCSWTPQNGPASWGLNTRPCKFSLTVNLVPEITYDGYETTLPIAPAGDRGLDDLVPDYMREEGYYADGQRDNAAHYMRITLGGFDILNVSLEREGNNLTYATPAGGMVSNGHGILAAEETDFIIGVLAADAFGPFNEEFADRNGQVGPKGVPLPLVTDSRAFRKLQTGFGRYTLRVRHEAFYDGPLLNGELRPACIAYGQWRAYHIDTHSILDSTLEITLDQPISATRKLPMGAHRPFGIHAYE